MNYKKCPRGFGLRDGLGPHCKKFINSKNISKIAKNSVFSQTAKNIAVGTLTNFGVMAASKIIEKISDKDSLFSDKIENRKQEVIVVDAVKDDEGRE